jgi:hypothetical protein
VALGETACVQYSCEPPWADIQSARLLPRADGVEEIRKASNEPVALISEELATMSNPGTQLAIEKLLPLASFAPGAYNLTVSKGARFTVVD